MEVRKSFFQHVWKRPTGTYSNLAQLNVKKKWPSGGAFAHPAGRTCGAFEQLLGTVGGECDHQKSEKFKYRGVRVARGEGDVEATN